MWSIQQGKLVHVAIRFLLSHKINLSLLVLVPSSRRQPWLSCSLHKAMQCLHHSLASSAPTAMDSPSFSSLGSNDGADDDDTDAAWPLHGSQAITSASAGALLPLHRQLPPNSACECDYENETTRSHTLHGPTSTSSVTKSQPVYSSYITRSASEAYI